MSLQPNGGGYLPTPYGTQNGSSPGERSPKRQKMSPPAGTPSVTFKTPTAPAARVNHPQSSAQGEEELEKAGKGSNTNVSDLGDILFNSGVNEKEEEEFLLSSTRRQQQLAASTPYANQQRQQSTSFDLLSSGSFPSIGQRPGNLGTPVKSEEDVAQQLENKHRSAIRAFNEQRQRHLEDPFLWANSMRFRMERIANDNGIKIPMSGLFDKIDRNKLIENKETKESKHKDEGGGSIQMEKAPSILHKGVALDGIMSLLSLAANDRIRNLIEESYQLARGRQFGSDGKVPEEWADLAAPQHQEEAPLTNGDTSHAPLPRPPKVMPTAEFLAEATKADRQAEEARLKKRAERRKRKDAAAANTSTPNANGDTNMGGTTALTDSTGNTPGPAASLVAPEPKLSKKERERLAKQDVSEEVQAKQTNSALSLAMGSKKYSWMNNAAKKSGAGTPLGASRGGTPGPTAKVVKKAIDPNELGKDGLPNKQLDRKFGEWREDGPGGEDVQLRDWVNALDFDGRERRALAGAMMRLGRERLLDGEQA